MEEPTTRTTLPAKNPRDKANIFSRLFFCWLDPLFCTGVCNPLEHSDLYECPSEIDSHLLLNKFNRHWQQELKRGSNNTRFWLAITKCIWWRIIIHGILNLIEVSLQVVQSIFVGYIAEYFSYEDPTSEQVRDACLFCLGLLLSGFGVFFIHGLGFHMGFMTSMDIRVITTSAIYQKVLSLDQTTVSKLTIGHIVNLASNDVHKFDLAFIYYHYLWISPLQLAVVTYLLYNELGVSAFCAAVLVLVQAPFQIIAAKLFSIIRLKAARITDKRIKVMNEVIVGIRVIKMYAWEYVFSNVVNKIRKSEMMMVLKGAAIRAFNLSYFSFSPPVIMFVTFAVHLFMGQDLTPRAVFTTLSLLSLVRLTGVHFIVQALSTMTEARVAVHRIENFLVLKELDMAAVNQWFDKPSNNKLPGSSSVDETVFAGAETDPSKETVISTNATNYGVHVKGLTASWYMEQDKVVLSNISFSVTKDSPLMAVVGPVGAGKSSLLQCILKELPALSGDMMITGKVAFASQESWLYSATLRENILFGLSYSPEWYSTVIEACALERDLELLPDGDLTLVGERGITLSGGQKARVNLARAVYRNADVYLLDDPLSAVDAAVSRHIFDRCIRGLLSEHCVILVTHQLQYVQQCDTVLVLKEGKQFLYGDTSVVLGEGQDIIELIRGEKEDPRLQYGTRKYSVVNDDEHPMPNVISVSPVIEEEEGDIPSPLLIQPPLLDTVSVSTYSVNPNKPKEVPESKKSSGVMSQPTESRAHGTITLMTYYRYFTTHKGHLFTMVVFAIFLLTEGFIVVDDWWLSIRATCNQSNDTICNLTVSQYIGVYGGLTATVLLFSCLRTFLLVILLLRSSTLLHNKMFATILRSPVLFYDTNPVGRILNRFSKDIGFLDDFVPYIFCEYLVLAMRFLAIVITAISSNPLLILLVAVLLASALGFRWYYLRTAREIKRLEALARSPIYSHLSTTIQGLPVIRSYSMQSVAIETFHTFQNKHSCTWYFYLVSNRWFGMRIDLISNIFTGIVSFSSVLFRLSTAIQLDPALLGLALTYAVTLNVMLQYTVRQSAEVENLMVSAERVMDYCTLESEASLETLLDSNKPPPNWPEKGQIELADVTYRHSTNGPLVLKGISVKIQPCEKIGIVGRTGAGKSSLIATLFRLAEPGGRIKIDGVDCLNLGLHDVRNKISIIPQDPVLFSGTVRYNLDPFEQYNDLDVWKALEQVQLAGVVDDLDGKLNASVNEGGGNFSVGQRQLFCLARAMLKKNRILVLDEATANVDLETDAIIQNILRDEFRDQTVLTIAHRLDTVMDSDKIMVLRAGELIEFGEPYQLLSNSSSYLLRLVDYTGPVAAQRLKNMAQIAHEQKKTL